MNIAHIEPYSFIYGPGCRYVIWTQGCSIHCKGCWNRSMWEFEPKNIISTDELWSKILQEKQFIEGITLLGGEPLDQFEAVYELCKKCQEDDLSVMLFTGYEWEELFVRNFHPIIEYVDILITGRYDNSQRTLSHQWIGSINQKIYFLSSRYQNYQIQNANYIEISINENSKQTILGFPTKAFLESNNRN